MNQTACHLANREGLPRAVPGRFLLAGGGWTKKVINKRKESSISGEDIFFGGEGDDRGLNTEITSLVIIGKFQINCVRVTFLGDVEIAIKS